MNEDIDRIRDKVLSVLNSENPIYVEEVDWNRDTTWFEYPIDSSEFKVYTFSATLSPSESDSCNEDEREKLL